MAGTQRPNQTIANHVQARIRRQQEVLTGLIGAPIAHSASPAMHERAAEALGLRGHYQLIEVAGAERPGSRMMLEGVRRSAFPASTSLSLTRKRWSRCSTSWRRARPRSARSTPSSSGTAG